MKMLQIYLALYCLMGLTLGNHLPCKNRGQYPPIVSAADACWGSSVWSNVKNNVQYVFPKVAGSKTDIFFIPNHITTDIWSLPLQSNPLPFRQLTRTSISDYDKPINSYSMKFECKGTVRAGCFDLPKISPFGPNDYPTQWYVEFKSSGSQLTCNQALFQSQGGNNAATYTNGVDTQRFDWFNKECVCAYDKDQCDFTKWVSGRDSPGQAVIAEDDLIGVTGKIQLKDKTSKTTGRLEVKQDTALRKIFNITGMTSTGFGIHFRLEVVVCGQETLTADTTTYSTWLILNLPNTGPSGPVHTVSASTDVNTWFTLSYPAPTGETYDWSPVPNGVQNCTMQTTGLYQDSAGNTPYTHSQITYDTTSAKSALGFYDIKFDQTAPYLEQNFYIVGVTMGGKKAARPIRAEICGSETVTPNTGGGTSFPATTPTYSYDLNDGGGTMNPGLVTVSTAGRWIINSNICGIVSYDVVGPDKNTISTFAYLSSNNLRISTTNPTSPYTQTHYIRAKTVSGRYGYYAFKIEICGAETVSVSSSVTSFLPFYHYNFGEYGTLANVPDVTQYFSTSNPSCPIVSFYMDRWNGASFVLWAANGDNSKVTYIDGGNNHKTHTIDDVSTVNSWAPVDRSDLYVVARTKAGLPSNFARYNFRVKVCGAETLTQNLAAQTKFVFQQGIITETIDMQSYRTVSDSLCPVQSITLNTSPDNGVTYNQWVDNARTMTVPGWSINVNTMTPQSWKVYIKTQTVTNYVTRKILSYDTIEIKVCGGEIISTIYAPTGTNPSFFHTPDLGSKDLMPDLNAVFTNNDPIDCPIAFYELMESTTAANTEQQLSLTGTFPNQAITLQPRKNMKRWFYIRATTKSKVRYSQRFEVHVCGFETIMTKSPVVYMYQKGDGVLNRTTEFFGDLIYSSDAQICVITTWNLYNETGLTDASLMYPDYTKTNFHVITTYANHEFYRLVAETQGKIKGTLYIEVEVCGDENVVLKPYTPTEVKVDYLQYSGYNRIQTIRPNKIFDSLMSNSRNCPLDKTMSELFYEIFDDYANVPIGLEIYRNLTAQYHKSKFEIYVNTTNATKLDLLIMIKTKASKPFYFPLNITIRPWPTKVFNLKPVFQEPNGYTFNFTLDHELPRYVMKLNVTKQFDDHNKKKWLNFTSHNLGDLRVKYDLETQEPKLDQVVKQFLSYDTGNFTLDVMFQGGPEGLYQYANVVYRVKATIQDHLGLFSEKTIQLNITVNETWYQAWLRRNWRPPHVSNNVRQPVGRIFRISPFGEVEVEFNTSSEWKPRKFESLDQINKNWLNLYIQPAEDWHIWSAQKISTVNFTWEFREFSEKRMRIKIDFNQPLEVSPKLRYDRLVIFVNDNSKMFETVSSGRVLSDSVHQMYMSKPCQKQMIENKAAREMIKQAYDVRWSLTIFFIFFLLLGFVFRSPLDRMLKMILELQFMVNMALMHVTIPANSLVGLTILKPFAEFRFQKAFSQDQSGYKELVYSSEEQMAYFGQRFTFGYDTYNVFFNIGTMGHIIVIFLFYILAVYIMLKTVIFMNARSSVIRFYSAMLERLIFSDLLVLMVCSCLEFGAAVLISFNDFTWQTNSVMNIIFSLVILVGLIVSIPGMFMKIDTKKKKGKFYELDLGARYGMSLLGFKPSYILRANQNLKYLASYLMLRVFFLMIVFLISSGWVQIIYMVFLFQAYITFIAHSRPMHGWWSNTFQLFNLCSVMICLYHMICFTDFANLPGEYEMGFSMIQWIYIYILINMLFVWLEFIKALYLMIKLWWGHIIEHYWRRFVDWVSTIWKRFIDWLSKKWERFLAWLRALCNKLNPWIYILAWIAYLKKLFEKKEKERVKPKVEILKAAEAIIERPPTPPKPPTPKKKILKLVNGVWTQTFVSIQDNQNQKDFLVTETAKKNWSMLGAKKDTEADKQSESQQSSKPKVVFGDGSQLPSDDVINHRKIDYQLVDGVWQPVQELQSTNKHNKEQSKDWLNLAARAKKNIIEKPKEDQNSKEESSGSSSGSVQVSDDSDSNNGQQLSAKTKPVFKAPKPMIASKDKLHIIPESDNEDQPQTSPKKLESPAVSKTPPKAETPPPQPEKDSLTKAQSSRWSLFDKQLLALTQNMTQPEREEKAKFHDPSLYFNDDKEKTAVEVKMTGVDGKTLTRMLEQNPNASRARNLWGKHASAQESDNEDE